MISGLIIYSSVDKEKNTWFISECVQRFADKGVSLLYKDEKEINDSLDYRKFSFALYRGRNHEIVEFLENKGIRCFNNSLTNKTANDKYLTYRFLLDKGLAVIPSFSSLEELDAFPLVMKSADGHGGQEVYLINSKEEAETFKKQNKKYVYQKYYPNDGDLRLYVLNKKVIGAVYRQNKTDFRSNFSLGGEVVAYKPDEELMNVAITVASLLDADYIGADFMNVDGKWLINEVEDPVGARTLYKTSNIDVISLLVDHILKSIKI